MKEKGRDESIEERKASMYDYLLNKDMSRLAGIVDCLVEVGQELEHMDTKSISKKHVFRCVDELLLGADKKYEHLLNKTSEGEPDFLGRSQGYRAMLEIIQGVVRMSGHR